MPIQKFSVRVKEAEIINDKFRYVCFELVEPNHIDFIAGQYILLDVPGDDQKKSYSIASSPAIGHEIDLLVDISPHGKGTTYIASLKPGDTATFTAPIGQFIVADPQSEVGQQEKALSFVATGSGITPIRSMILDLLQVKHETRPMVLYWGLRSEQDAFWYEDFQELSDTHKNFHFHPVLSKGGDEWPLCRGRVTDCLKIHPMQESGGFYLCGNKAMVEDVRQFLYSKGVVEAHIHHEKFY